jgi:hypothetical protein
VPAFGSETNVGLILAEYWLIFAHAFVFFGGFWIAPL